MKNRILVSVSILFAVMFVGGVSAQERKMEDKKSLTPQ